MKLRNREEITTATPPPRRRLGGGDSAQSRGTPSPGLPTRGRETAMQDSSVIHAQCLSTIGNRYVSLSVDDRGCLVGMKNRLTGSELITHSDAVEGWRMVLPSGPLTVDIACASMQRPGRVEIEEDGGVQSLVIVHEAIRVAGRRLRIRVKCTFTLAADGCEIVAQAEIDNRSNRSVDEFEFPLVGGLGGFSGKDGKRHMELVVAGDRGRFYGDVLQNGLPYTGAESGIIHPDLRHGLLRTAAPICSRPGSRPVAGFVRRQTGRVLWC